jgi:hypothetical protein
VHGLESKWGERVRFSYLDIDDPRTDGFKSELGYRYQPHLFLLDSEGKILNQWIGAVDGMELQRAIAQASS